MTYPLTVPVTSHISDPTQTVIPSIPIINVGSPATRVWNKLNPPLGARSGHIQTVVPLIPIIKVGSPAIRAWSPLVLLGDFPADVTYGQFWPRSARDRP